MKRAKTRSGVTIQEANLRIAELRKHQVETAIEPENLDVPLDGDFQVRLIEPKGGPKRTRIALVIDGQDASWCEVVHFRQQFGPAHLRMGGIANVGTHEDHRFKGYSRRVMQNVLRYMRREGFDVTMLYGITSYYPKYGYAVVFPTVTHTIAVRDAERMPARQFKFVDFQPKHTQAVLEMYDANNAGRIGPVRRELGAWIPWRIGMQWNTKAAARVALDSRGKPVGYFAYDVNFSGNFTEVGCASREVLPAVLRQATAMTWRARNENVVFHLPEDDALMALCQPCGMKKEVRYRSDGDAMVRLINVPVALAKLAPLIGPRTTGRGQLTLRTNLDSATLSWSSGKVKVARPAAAAPAVRLPQWALAQLIYGYGQVEVMSQMGIAKGAPAALAKLAQLFPPTLHYHYRADYF